MPTFVPTKVLDVNGFGGTYGDRKWPKSKALCGFRDFFGCPKTSKWCPGPESNRHGVATEGFSYQLQLLLLLKKAFVVWTFSSPYLHMLLAIANLGGCRQVSTRSLPLTLALFPRGERV